MSVEHFFDRGDADKIFLKEQIMKSENPGKTMKNFLACMEAICSKEYYDECADSGFFTIARKDITTDTKAKTMAILARHFGLTN